MPKVISRGKIKVGEKEYNLSNFDDTRYSTPIPKTQAMLGQTKNIKVRGRGGLGRGRSGMGM